MHGLYIEPYEAEDSEPEDESEDEEYLEGEFRRDTTNGSAEELKGCVEFSQETWIKPYDKSQAQYPLPMDAASNWPQTQAFL
ncbi:hypothetical protein DPEC_G00058850 [Dallia pectoralis]|uniref:Uncharacterized protein n=1 Tax=Dallia pectoralis TaxID=75939 RepID=A0ACC2H7J0_DALPE|nr:hypothetical protein DPEC_G00058850 [Dallia pectoralis]